MVVAARVRELAWPSVELSFIRRRRWIVFRLQFVALVVDLGAAFAGSALSSGLCEHIQRTESRLLQQVTGGVTETNNKINRSAGHSTFATRCHYLEISSNSTEISIKNLRSQLAEQVTGVRCVTGAFSVGLAHDTLHANLLLGLVGVDVSLSSHSNEKFHYSNQFQ